MTPPLNECELDIVMKLLIKDFTKAQIRKKLGLKPSTLANRLRRLEDLGFIERDGKYLIKVLKKTLPSSHMHPRVTRNQVHMKLNKRGHAYNFRIIFPNEKDLRKKPNVINELRKGKLTKLPFDSLKFTKDKNSIWINKETLTIYSNNSYYSDDALLTKFRALKEIDTLVKNLKQRFEFRGIYGIEVFREHYGLIFNKFAKWVLKQGKKFYLKDKGNKAILWVDDSRKDDINLEEFEGKDALKINKADKFFESQEKTDWKVTPEFILNGFAETTEAIKKNAGQLEYFGENMVSHVAIMKRIDKKLDTMDKREERFVKAIEGLAEK